MKLEDLITSVRENLNAKITARNEQTTALNELRSAEGFDTAREDELMAQRANVDAEIEALRKRLTDYEGELRSDQAVDRLSEQVGTVSQRSGDGVTRTERVEVTEKRTYRKDIDQRGQGKEFMNDIAAAFVGDWSARQRLDAHMREERTKRPEVFTRAVGVGAFTGFVVPQYLVDMNVGQATARRPFADICNGHTLPEKGMAVYLSKITTGSTVALQANEGDAVSETDMDDTLITINVQTAAGSQSISRQAIERGLGVEEIVWGDLQKRHAARLDATLLNQATNGLTNVATAVAYTDGSPTAPELYPKILGAVSASEAIFMNDVDVDTVVMHPRRWRWLSAAMTSTWPFISGARVPAQSAAVTEGVGYDKGIRGYLPDGTAVVTDANVATNLGAGTNEDEIYAVGRQELHLWEDPKAPMFIRAEQTRAKNLQIDLVLYSYFAYYFNRYTGGHSKVAGTGLVTPVFA